MPSQNLWNGNIDVSIVMPAFNAEQYIEIAIRSAQQQSLSSIEVIVIDDASTDRTPEIVQQLASQDPRIQYIRMAVNGGPAASRNHALVLARGEWIALLDADDRFHPDRLERLLSLARSEKADIVSDNLMRCIGSDEVGQPMIAPERLSRPQFMSFKDFIEGCMYRHDTPRGVNYAYMQPLFRRDFMQRHHLRYDELVRFGEDLLLSFDCFLAGAKWFITPEPMYYYNLHDNSLTSAVSYDGWRRLIDRMKALPADPRVRNEKGAADAMRKYWRLIARDCYYGLVKNALRSADPKTALQVLFQDGTTFGLVAEKVVRRGLERL